MSVSLAGCSSEFPSNTNAPALRVEEARALRDCVSRQHADDEKSSSVQPLPLLGVEEGRKARKRHEDEQRTTDGQGGMPPRPGPRPVAAPAGQAVRRHGPDAEAPDQAATGRSAELFGSMRIFACTSGSPSASKALSTPGSPTVPVTSGVGSTSPSASMCRVSRNSSGV